MEVNRQGATRIVLLTKCHAIKVPNFMNGWRLFLTGLLCNMQERAFSKTDWPELCPVNFSLPGGWLVVMPRCRVMTDEEFLNFNAYIFIHKEYYTVPTELKANSFGYLDNRIVVIDYGS